MNTAPGRDSRRALIDCAFLGAAALLIGLQLFVPPALSVADTNDFQKLAGRVCLGPYPEQVLFDYTELHWRFSHDACISWPMRSSAEAALRVAMGLNRLFGAPPNFDLRWMGVVYAAFFLAGLGWLQRALRAVPLATSVAAQAGFVLVACNAVYIPYFNTFYFDSATLVAMVPALTGLAVLLLRPESPRWTFWLTAASLAVLGLSKGQHSLMALAAIPAFWMARGRKAFPPVWARACASGLVAAGAAIAILTVPSGYRAQATFSALFYRILPSTPNPAAYLAETGLPPSYLAYVGDNGFSHGTPLSEPGGAARFDRMFGTADLAAFFLRHPAIAWRMLMIHLDEGSYDRVRMKTGNIAHRLGNYERETGKPPRTLSHSLCYWPAAKHALIAGRPRLYLGYILAVIAALWLLAPRAPGMRALLATVTAILAVSLLMVMTDGIESGRHLMIFNYLLDLAVAAAAAMAVHRLAVRRGARQEALTK